MREYAVLVASILYGVATIVYCILAVRRKIEPVFATWLIFGIAIFLGLLTYFSQSQDSTSAIRYASSIIDFFTVWGVVLLLLILQKKSAWRFNRFQAICLAVVAVILVFWFVSKEHVISNLLLQSLMVVAYFPTINQLRISKTNTESFLVWVMIGIGSIILLYPAYTGKDLLSRVYATRATISILTLLVMMLWVEIRVKKLKGGH